MQDFSTLIGGIAGEGINEAGVVIGRLFSRLGYCIFMYNDYQSLIKGGHNFSLVRASEHKIGVHLDKVDAIVALNQETLKLHRKRLKESSIVIYDSEKAKVEELKVRACGLPLSTILKEEKAPAIMGNTCIIGGFCRATGIAWTILEEVVRKHIPKKVDLNLKVARRGYDAAEEIIKIDALDRPSLPVLTGNQAIGLGLLKAGLEAYVAYPMTPSTSLLHFMAGYAAEFGLKVVHPENEIAVMLISLGFAYGGIKTAVGTSGGGFCLMNEGLSLAGMAELPAVIVLGQRTGPSTGLPTYTGQGDLHFVLSAGQGEFPRLVVAPGDAEEAYFWSGVALNLAWKYQLPSFILSDKTLSESLYSFDLAAAGELKEEEPLLWAEEEGYRRYSYTETGVSPLAYPPRKGAAVKVDGYVHDQLGITTEDPKITKEMADKRLIKGQSLASELEGYETVKVYGQGSTTLLCWGSNKGVCIEAGKNFGLKVVQVLVLSPFPAGKLGDALKGTQRLIDVECNSTGQLAKLAGLYGLQADDLVLKYDGRPFSLEDLEEELGRRDA
jgi:2-oxoglutarate ferredoxin oxidoreductase subunit alpha